MQGHEEVRHSRIAVIGTGFSGLGIAIGLKRAGIEDFVILERAADVGGTWRDNTYPGCQCDVPSHLYSFSFRPNPEWTRTFSTQPEIQAYLQRCAKEMDVLPHIHFDHDVQRVAWSESDARWFIETSAGPWSADYLISANGGLAEPSYPDIPGLEDFGGRVIHSAEWDQDLDLAGKRVAVIGTGASAIQIVPRIQPLVDELHVFQRTPAWILPHTDRPISERERRVYRRFPIVQRAARGLIYWARELLVVGMAKNRRFLKPLRRLALAHMHRQVKDGDLRRKLTPRYEPGCKRLLLSNDFYPALATPNTQLVTEPIAEIRSDAIVTGDGAIREVDAIVVATGFRVTDNPMVAHIKGRDGRSMSETWSESGMRAYLGTTVENFPNLFLMTGPNTGIGHTSLLVMIEAQIDYVVSALRYAERNDVATLEVRPGALESFNRELQGKMKGTVWTMGGCASWYLDDSGGNPTLWPDFTFRFRNQTKRFDPSSYVIERRGARQRVKAAR